MNQLKKFNNFIFESYGSNKLSENLTGFLLKKINCDLGKLLLNRQLTIENYLQDNYLYLLKSLD